MVRVLGRSVSVARVVALAVVVVVGGASVWVLSDSGSDPQGPRRDPEASGHGDRALAPAAQLRAAPANQADGDGAQDAPSPKPSAPSAPPEPRLEDLSDYCRAGEWGKAIRALQVTLSGSIADRSYRDDLSTWLTLLLLEFGERDAAFEATVNMIRGYAQNADDPNLKKDPFRRSLFLNTTRLSEGAPGTRTLRSFVLSAYGRLKIERLGPAEVGRRLSGRVESRFVQAFLADPAGEDRLPVARCLHEFLVLNDRLELERQRSSNDELLRSIASFAASYRDSTDENCASYAQYFLRMFPELEAEGPGE